MIGYRKYLYSLAPVLFIFGVSGHCFAQIDARVEKQLATTFEKSAEEVILGDGVKIRGRQIGRGQFKPCKGDPIDIGDSKPDPSDPCPQDPGTYQLRLKKVTPLSFDTDKRILKVRVEGGEELEIFIPPSAVLIEGGKDPSPMSMESLLHPSQRSISVVYVLEGRAEAFLIN